MAKGYGIEVSDVVLLGGVALIGYTLYKGFQTIGKPLSDVASAGSTVATETAETIKAPLDFYQQAFKTQTDLLGALANKIKQSQIVKEEVIYREPVTQEKLNKLVEEKAQGQTYVSSSGSLVLGSDASKYLSQNALSSIINQTSAISSTASNKKPQDILKSTKSNSSISSKNISYKTGLKSSTFRT